LDLYLEREARIYTWRERLGSIPGERSSDLVSNPDLPVDEGVEDGQQEEGEQVQENQVQPVDVDLPK
jgi:hypothetical protein